MPKQGTGARTGVQHYETPLYFVDRIEAYMGMPVIWDLASSHANALAYYRLGPDHPNPSLRDALSVDWEIAVRSSVRGFAWLNHPYGTRENRIWTAKIAREASSMILPVVALLPSAPDTRWWHESVLRTAWEIIDIEGRIQFWLEGKPLPRKLNEKTGRPETPSSSMASVVAVWRPGRRPYPQPIRVAPISGREPKE